MEQAADVPPPPWQRLPPERGARRRRDPLTREAIVDTALRLLDAEGLDALSMRRVAEELDAGAASLYWHVGSKDGLLDLLLDRIIGEIVVPAPEPGRWAEQLREVARALRRTILSHRDVVRISLGRVPMGPNALAFSEGLLAVLRAGGLPDRLAVQGQHLLIATVNGFTLDETHEEAGAADGPSAAEIGQLVVGYIASLPADRFPHMTAVAAEYGDVDVDARFDLLLDIYVDGLARHAAAG